MLFSDRYMRVSVKVESMRRYMSRLGAFLFPSSSTFRSVNETLSIDHYIDRGEQLNQGSYVLKTIKCWLPLEISTQSLRIWLASFTLEPRTVKFCVE